MNKSISFADLALQFDAAEKPLEAAWAYEIALPSSGTPDLSLNLLMIYFAASDYGYEVRHKLSRDFVDASWERMWVIFELAFEQFGKTNELVFWKHYISSLYSEEMGIQDFCRNLVSDNDSLLPALYLFTCGEQAYLEQVRVLLKKVGEGRTERDRYVKSVAEAALSRYEFDRNSLRSTSDLSAD